LLRCRVHGALGLLGRLLLEAGRRLPRHACVSGWLRAFLKFEALGCPCLLCDFALLMNESQIAGRVNL